MQELRAAHLLFQWTAQIHKSLQENSTTGFRSKTDVGLEDTLEV